MKEEIKLLVVDLFSGAGGVSTGFEKTEGCKVIVCINHDENAIKSHKANHPDAFHFVEDIRTVKMDLLINIVNSFKKDYPGAKLLVHASLECTNFSKAKGGKPRDADSRSLADDMPRYSMALNPDYFTIENVSEFLSWGPLDENGKPISRQCGIDYLRFVDEMKSINEGYDYDYRFLTAADFGAYTIRKRYFAAFYKKGLVCNWPTPTHSKKPENSLFGNLQKWKAVKDVLDLEDKGNSIFEKQRSEKTYERIYEGLVKFSGSKNPTHLLKYNSINGKTGKYCPPSIEEPCPTIAAQARLCLVSPEFLIQYNGKPKDSVNNIDKPTGTITTKDRFAIAQPEFILRDFTKGYLSSIEEPAGALLTVPKINLVSTENYFLMNPQWGTKQSRSIDEPCFTLIARMDKTPPYLVMVKTGEVYIKVFETDSPMVVKIKQFMAEHGIYDIKMRMLKIVELLKIQGFPGNYKLVGTQTEQKKFIGNSVEVTLMHSWAKEIVKTIKKQNAA